MPVQNFEAPTSIAYASKPLGEDDSLGNFSVKSIRRRLTHSIGKRFYPFVVGCCLYTELRNKNGAIVISREIAPDLRLRRSIVKIVEQKEIFRSERRDIKSDGSRQKLV